MLDIVYEDDELQAFWLHGHSEFAVISFGDLVTLADGKTFSILKPASKLGLSCLGIMAKRPNWYPRENLLKLWLAVSPLLEPFKERVLYGASMGGHGAIKSSSLMGATTTIALCPQWSIDPESDETSDLGWRDYFDRTVMNGMAIKAEDIRENIFIFSDPGENRDEIHRVKIASLCDQPFLINVHSCDHNVTPVLAGTENFHEILQLCRAQKIDRLRSVVNRIRRPHFFRKKGLIEKGIVRHPQLTFEISIRAMQADPLIREIVSSLGGQFKMISSQLMREMRSAESIAFAIDNAGSVREKFRLSLLFHQASKTSLGLFTIFGTQVSYDPLNNRLVHAISPEESINILPIKLYLDNQKLQLFVSNQHCRFLVPDAIELITEDGFSFAVTEVGNQAITLQRQGVYLSADPSGSVSCDRHVAADWELFSIQTTRPVAREEPYSVSRKAKQLLS